jgi:valyl-tRNA synthetase
MRKIQPWCISRQLWWGHRIPAWYGPDGAVFVEESEAAAQEEANRHYGRTVALRRDEDVLDTWFSSGLWPFSTLGWPDDTPELKRYYPTDVLVTGFDIIFFWVARMMMQGIHFMGEVPFRTVYIHGLVRDLQGQKMSKAKGNVIDPIALVDKYGADALRFTMAALTAPGRDVKPTEERIEGYRNFATKLWNATRFCLMNECRPAPGFDPGRCRVPINRWMVGRIVALTRAVDDALAGYRLDDAANTLYHGIWHEFCDWYVEFSKPVLTGADEAARAETRAAAAWTLGQLLHLLHPFMPFITEELWMHLAGGESAPLLATSPWPKLGEDLIDAEATADIDWVIRLTTEIRARRAEMNVPPAAQLPVLLRDAGPATRARLATHRELVMRPARLASIEPMDGAVPKGAVQFVVDEATVVLPLAGIVDLDQERARLRREIEKHGAEAGKLRKKLENAQFLAKAPPEVVDELRERLAEAEAAEARLRAALRRLEET